MNKDLIIQTSDGGAEIALLEDRRLVELHHEEVDEDYLVGDIYLGRVRKVLPGLNAAFIDIGHEKDAFLHYLDLGPDVRSFSKYVDLVRRGRMKDTRLENFRFEPQIVKTGKIDEILAANQYIVVQIVKEPISTKGPRLTSQITLSGRYIILIPFSDALSLSKKIKLKTERDRLRKLVSELKPKNFGVIIRTNAEEAPDEEIRQDMEKLMRGWDNMIKELEEGKHKLHSEPGRKESILRDIMNDTFSRIMVDNPKVQKQLKTYVQQISPGQEDIVKLQKGDRPLFEQFDIDKQIRSLFGKIVNLGGGAYLIVEHTEAMHVIDVNSGSKRNKDDNQEGSALKINMEAAMEIARQLRLRDMGGIVIVDFIDMRSAANRKLVFDRFRDIMKDDRAKHTILPLTKFGLLQITRQRVRPEIILNTSEICPVCNGTGQVDRGINITEEIKRSIDYKIKKDHIKSLHLIVHPYVDAFLTKGLVSTRLKWMWEYKCRITIEDNSEFLLNQYELA